MRKFGLIGVLLVGLLSVTLLRPVSAQGTWCYTFDFESTDGGFTVLADTGGDYIGGSGWRTAYWVGVELRGYRSVALEKSFSTTLTSLTISVDVSTPGSPIYPSNWVYVEASSGPLITTGGTPGFGNYQYNWSGSEVVTGLTNVQVSAGYADDTSDPGGSATLKTITMEGEGTNPFGDDNCTPGTGGLTRPIAAADEHADWGMFDYDLAHAANATYGEGQTVYAYSTNFGASVAAVADGTVISVVPFTVEANCATEFSGIAFGSLRLCYVPVPGVVTGEDYSQIYSLDMVGNWIVTVEDAINPSIIYAYAVHAPTVQVGDQVAAGCIIGQTIQIKQMDFGILNVAINILSATISGGIGFLSNPTNAGVTIVEMHNDGEIQSLLPSLTEQPSLADCQEQQLSACINNNPNLTSFAYYERASDVTLLDGGGVTIPSFNYILQNDIMIDPEADYILSVQARKRETGDDTDHSTMNLQLGSELQSFEVEGSYNNYTFTPTGDDWHTDNLTSIFVSNQPSSVAPIEVRYICLAPVTASTAPGSCYFANNEFDADASGWDVSATTFGTGQAFMRDGSTLSQVVTLMPDNEVTPHTYTVRAVARLIATGSYTGQIGKSVTLNYEYPVLTDGEIGTIDSTLVTEQGKNLVSGNVEFDYPYTLETTIEVNAETTSTFTFSVVVEDADDYIQGLRIDSVCIDPSGDGTFPGQTGGGGYSPPFIVGCAVVPVPTENSIGPWTFYHWANLRRFFTCDLMKLLNKWFNLFDQFRITMLKVARYWIVLLQTGSKWLTGFLWWLNGSFRNIAEGQVTYVQGDNQCHGIDIGCIISSIFNPGGTNIFDVLLAAINGLLNIAGQVIGLLIALIVQAANVLFTVIVGAIIFVIKLIGQALALLKLGQELLATIINAYNNAAPIAIPGLPMCDIDPHSSGFCVAVWVMDNTIFSGPGVAIIPLLVGIGSIHLLLWVVAELRKTVLEVGNSA